MMVYYRTFSVNVFLMALFIFVILLLIDIIKDTLTKNADKIFGYTTIPNYFGSEISRGVIIFLCISLMVCSALIVNLNGIHSFLDIYFAIGLLVTVAVTILSMQSFKKSNFYALNMLRVWIFVGIIAMLLDGIYSQF